MKEYYILSNRQREYLRELRTWLIKNKCEDKVQWYSEWDTFPTTKTIYLPIDKVSRILANNSYYPNDRNEMNALREYYKRVKKGLTLTE